MKFMKLKAGLVATLTLLLLAGGCASVSTTKVDSVSNPQTQVLERGNWDVFNLNQLNKMMAENGKGSKNYNPNKRPYVVFDWDNTCCIFDIQEAAYVYQLKHLIFAMTPKQLDVAIRKDLPKENFDKDYNNAEGKAVNIDLLAPDIVKAYTTLYYSYKGLKGNKTLEQVMKMPAYMEFITKMRYLYAAVGDTFDVAISYPWVTYMYTGMTEKEVRDITAKTVAWQNAEKPAKVKWTSPKIKSKAGQVSVSWITGLRLTPEVKDLYAKLRANGIDVYVCSASFLDVIKEVSSNPEFGYNNPDSMVMAMELERDAKGRIQTEFRHGYDQTQGKGKTKTIERFLVSKKGYGPIMIAGDSEGDQNMMSDFDSIKTILIFNRYRKPTTIIGKLSKEAVPSYGKYNAKVLLQGRDENTGMLRPSQKSILLGKKEEVLLRK